MAPISGGGAGEPTVPSDEPVEILLFATDRDRADEIAARIQTGDDRFDVWAVSEFDSAVERLDSRKFDCVLATADGETPDGLDLYRDVTADEVGPFILIVDDSRRGCEALEAGVSAIHRRGDNRPGDELLARRIARVVDRHRSESTLEEHARRLETLIGNLPGVVYRCRIEGGWPMEYVRGECEKLTGYSEERLESGEIRWGDDVIHPNDRSAVWETVDESMASGRRFELSYRIQTADGTTKWVWERGQRIEGPGGGDRIEGFITDVSDRREREQQLQVIGHLLRHNVRNDMTIIRGHAETIRDDDGPFEAAGETIVERADELCRTVEKARPIVDILTNARDLRAVDLPTAITRIVDDVEQRESATSITVSVPDSLRVEAIPELERGLYELIENAVTHQNGGESTVDVTVEETDGTVSIRIVDEGPAIPEMEVTVLDGERDLDQLYHGSGLGLWLAEWIVRRSGGTLSFARAEPGGNEVTVTLDRYQEPDDI